MPRATGLRLYGQASSAPPLEWAWVDAQLAAAGTYWVVARSAGHPHPRPVWGVWHDGRLALSIGTPATVRTLAADPVLTVHLDSGTDVVVVEGRAEGRLSDPALLGAYERKYDRSYDVSEYGPLTGVVPGVVLAWRAGGWAGRDGFRSAGRWEFDG